MNQAAPNWWNNPEQADSKPVVAHTPDETKYHYPDERQGSRMRSGIGAGVVIPRANNDGTSKGFDGRYAGVVHVDPDAPDGGAVVDCTQLNNEILSKAFEGSHYPHEVFYKLGVSPQNYQNQPTAPPPTVARVNPYVPEGAYVVPASTSDGAQVVYPPYSGGNPVQPVPPLPGSYNPQQQQPVAPQQQYAQQVSQPSQQPMAHIANPHIPMAPQPQPQQPQLQQQPQYAAPPQQQYAPPPQYYPPQQDPAIAALTQQMSQLTQLVGGMARQQQPTVPPGQYQPSGVAQSAATGLQTMPQQTNRQTPQPIPPMQTGVRPQNDEEYAPTQTLSQVDNQNRQDKAREGVVMGFETLNMSFLTGPIANKAKKDVYFEIPNAGTMSAKFHHIEDGGTVLALVYDTRYEDGNQYLPPDLGEQEIKVNIPKLKQTFMCRSLGLQFSLGVLDIVVLIKEAAAPPYEEED